MCGARATAEWMNVPPGTCTADTIAENANRIDGIDEERPEVDGPPPQPGADDHERHEEHRPDEDAVDPDRRDEAADAAREQRPDALAQEVLERASES